MNYSQIRELDIANGEGIGIALFVQGCPFHCKGCFNPETWDFDGGREWTNEIKERFIALSDKPYINRISILGGEPLAPKNVNDVLDLICDIRGRNIEKDIWLYTGYKLDEIKDFAPLVTAMSVDVLVDGQFEEKKKDITLKFRGSSNQRVIDIKAMRNQCSSKIIIKEGY